MSVFSDTVNELLRLQSDLESYLRAPRNDFFFGTSASGVFPPVNLFRDASGDVVIRTELPGVAPEDITVTSEPRRLTISGERKPAHVETGGYHRRERPWGKFSRTIELPADLDLERAEARFQHGVMTLRVPRAEAAKPRQISVQAT